MSEPANDNLKIWNHGFATDPKYTKAFKRSGGFAGTAINVVYNMRRATEIFGPIGVGFGFSVLSEQVLTGAPIRAENGDLLGHELIHEVKIDFWYRHPDTQEIGHITSSGATTFIGKNARGLFTDEEAVKKSITDAISKALSWLGFSADVFMGLYDDNKYVNDRTQEAAERAKAEAEAKKPKLSEKQLEMLATFHQRIEAATAETIKAVRDDIGVAKADGRIAAVVKIDKGAVLKLSQALMAKFQALGIDPELPKKEAPPANANAPAQAAE